jgi:hypothetical protein
MKSIIIDIYIIIIIISLSMESITSAKYISKLWYISGGWKYESCIIRCIVMCCHYYNMCMVWHSAQICTSPEWVQSGAQSLIFVCLHSNQSCNPTLPKMLYREYSVYPSISGTGYSTPPVAFLADILNFY